MTDKKGISINIDANMLTTLRNGLRKEIASLQRGANNQTNELLADTYKRAASEATQVLEHIDNQVRNAQ